jgi:hypothetical protein
MVKENKAPEAMNDKFLELIRDPKRIEVLPDGWFCDHLHGIDRAPLELIKNIYPSEAEEYMKSLDPSAVLPDNYQAFSLFDYERSPIIIEPFAKIPTDDWYLTRTPVKGHPDLVRAVSFGSGDLGYLGFRYNSLYVWPVRPSQYKKFNSLPVR